MPSVSSWERALGQIQSWGHVWPALGGLYLFSALTLLLPWPFGAHPAWAYNWEDYAAWRWETFWERPAGPLLAILAPSDGLMTDSGQGPLVGLPMSMGIALFGFDLDAMRLPVALLAAASVPVLWLLGRRVVGSGPATLAALLMAVSPPFLFYGRTATLVGVSLLPLLLMALALARVLDAGDDERWRWGREGALAGSLVLGIYAYAPIRLLWPLAIAMLGLAAIGNPWRRSVLARAAIVCALSVPAALLALEQIAAPDPDPVAAVVHYFNARGEQIMAMSDDPTEAGQYVRDLGAINLSVQEAALRLVAQNAADLGRLLLDRDTSPVPSDYWNERGRFWPWILVPFAVVGMLTTGLKALHDGPHAANRLLPLLLFLGLAVPLLLTSRVHVGRLLPALPFALLLAASGVWLGAGWLAEKFDRAGGGSATLTRWMAPILAGSLLLPIAVRAHGEMATPLSPSRASRTAATIAEWQHEAQERGGAVLVEDPALGDEIERVHAANYRLDLDGVFRFVDLQDSEPALIAAARPLLYWHGALRALQAGAIERPCERLWFVGPEITREFFAAWRAAGCVGAPDSVILP
jgi:4-amino-4-deoxy-L-arabinose transferase-like glycosyltransferase